MAPTRPSSRAHNTVNEALTGQKKCSYCGSKFKIQGFLSHERSCKKRKEDEEERVLVSRCYEESQKAARRHAASVLPRPGPSSLSMFSTAGQEHSHSFYFDDAVDPGPDPGLSNEPLLGEPGSQEEERQATPNVNGSAQPQAQSQSNNNQFEFKTEFHPRSRRVPIYQSYEAFRVQSRTPRHVEDPAPWRPFRTASDFEFAELVLDASLNKRQVEILLGLIARVAQGAAQVTLKNDAELRKTCDTAGEELTPVFLQT